MHSNPLSREELAQLDAQLNEPDTQNRLSALTAYNLSRALCTIRSLETENAALRAMLKRLEWSGSHATCPICHMSWVGEHWSNCALAALLKGDADENPAKTA